jgi:hypothetical protein
MLPDVASRETIGSGEHSVARMPEREIPRELVSAAAGDGLRSEELDVVLSRPISRRWRALRWAVVAVALLATLGLALGRAAAGRGPGARAVGTTVMLVSNVSSGVVTLNGRQQSGTLPLMLALRVGANEITLAAPPFQPQVCVVRAPVDPRRPEAAVMRGTCAIGAAGASAADGTVVVDFPLTDAALSSATRASALALIARVFADIPARTASVPAGQLYGVGVDGEGRPTAERATQPLRATLWLALADGDAGPQALLAPCHPLCAAPPDASVAFTPHAWAIEASPVLRWRFTTASGRVVGEETQPVMEMTYIALSYGDQGWRMVNSYPNAGASLADDLGQCAAGARVLDQLNQVERRATGPAMPVRTAAGIGGCELRLQGSDSTSQVLFVWRFGVLQTANAEAHTLFRELPLASPAEVAAVS